MDLFPTANCLSSALIGKEMDVLSAQAQSGFLILSEALRFFFCVNMKD